MARIHFPLKLLPSNLISTLTALFLIGSLSACDRLDRLTPAEHVQHAKSELVAGRPQSAAIELKNVLQKDGKNVEARLALADVFLAAGRGPEAEAETTRAEQFGATRDSTQVRRGRAYLLQSQYGRVLKEIPANIAGDPDYMADLFQIRGDAQSAMGQTREASDSYNAALKVRPNSIGALFGKARIFATQGDLKGSMDMVDAALALSPKNALGLMLKGDLLLVTSDMEAALKSYGDAVSFHPNDQAARLALASAQITAKKFDLAQKNLDIVTKALPNYPSANYLNALLQFTLGNNKGAFDAIQKVLAAIPDHPPSLILAGAIQYALGSQVQAELNTRKFLSFYPNNIYGRKLLAAILLKANQPTKAVEALEPLLSRSDITDPQVFSLAGNALIEAKQFPKAVEYLTRSAEMKPADLAVKTALGYGQLATGDVDRAISSFQSIVKLDTNNINAETFLILSYISKQEYQQAIDAASAMTQKDPNNGAVHNLLGGAYLAKKDFKAARESFEKALKLQPGLASPAINLAKMDLSENKPDDAKKHLTDLLAHDPKNSDALLALANIEFFEGHPDAGSRWIDTASKENPQLLIPKILQIRYLLQRGEAQRAANLAREVDAANPRSPEVLTLLAQSQIAVGDRSGAVSTYGRLANLQPTDARIPLEVARIEASDGHTTAASAAIAKALLINPDFLDAQVARAQLDIRTAKFDEAREIAAKIQKKPGFAATGFIIAGDAWMAQKKYERAIKSFESGFAAEKSWVSITKMHQALAQGGRNKEADDLLQSWLTDHQDDRLTRLYAAAYYQSTGATQKAEQLYQDVVRLDPNNAIALNELALILHAKKDPRALDFAERAYKLAPTSDSVADTLGWILVDGGDQTRGRQLLEKVVSSSPGNSEARYHLAVALFRAGDKERARSELKQALSSSKTFPQIEDAKKLLGQL